MILYKYQKKAVFGGRVSCDRNSSSPASSGSITESLLRLVVRQNRNKKLNWFTIDYLSGLASMCCKFHRFSAIQQKIHFFNSLCFEMQGLFSVLSISTIIICKLDKILDLKYAQFLTTYRGQYIGLVQLSFQVTNHHFSDFYLKSSVVVPLINADYICYKRLQSKSMRIALFH